MCRHDSAEHREENCPIFGRPTILIERRYSAFLRCLNTVFPQNGIMTPNGSQDRYDEFVDLFSRNARRVYGYIYAMLPRWADADDVFQETSRVLWQKFDEFQSGTNFFAWACQVARYQVLYYQQRERRDRVKFSDAFLDAVATSADAESERLETEQRLLAECVEKLDARQRQLVLSRFAPDATTKSVAARLGMSTEAVYKALSRVQTTLLRCIERAMGERGHQ